MSILEDAFGDIIRKARYGLGLSLEQVASATGIAASRLSVFEDYTDKPTRLEVERLAHLLQLGAEALWDSANEAWVPEPLGDQLPGSLELQQIVFPAMDANGYILTDRHRNGALLVDPGGLPDELMQRCTATGLPLCGCLITHAHADHVSALPQIMQAYPDLHIVVHREAALELQLQGNNISTCDADTSLDVGPFRIEVLTSPGHSPDGLVFHFDGIAFVGDTLFAGSLGRSQSGPKTYATLLSSAERIVNLPGDTILLPGHGPLTTVGNERVHNPFLSDRLRSVAQ